MFGFFASAVIIGLFVMLKRKPAWQHLRSALTASDQLVRKGI